VVETFRSHSFTTTVGMKIVFILITASTVVVDNLQNVNNI